MTDVVYVDDEPSLCRIFGRILERAEFEVKTFTNPTKALSYINEHPPRMIICDQRMPSMSGLQFFEALRVDVPFVLVSGDLDLEHQLPEGLTGFLPKPIFPETLIKTVEGIVRPSS